MVSGKSPTTFQSSKAAHAVADERAFSVHIRRPHPTSDEHIDLEAASKDERDRWASALRELTHTARCTAAEKEAKIRVVEVLTAVGASGDIAVTIAPVGEGGAQAAVGGQTQVAVPEGAGGRVVVTDAAAVREAAMASRTTATSTTTLEGQGKTTGGESDRVKALEEENAMLKARIAELEERMKGTQVDSVSAS